MGEAHNEAKPEMGENAAGATDATDGAADLDLAALAAAYLDLWERLSAARALIGPDGTGGAAVDEDGRGDAG